jgi:hypothetical protein
VAVRSKVAVSEVEAKIRERGSNKKFENQRTNARLASSAARGIFLATGAGLLEAPSKRWAILFTEFGGAAGSRMPFVTDDGMRAWAAAQTASHAAVRRGVFPASRVGLGSGIAAGIEATAAGAVEDEVAEMMGRVACWLAAGTAETMGAGDERSQTMGEADEAECDPLLVERRTTGTQTSVGSTSETSIAVSLLGSWRKRAGGVGTFAGIAATSSKI